MNPVKGEREQAEQQGVVDVNLVYDALAEPPPAKYFPYYPAAAEVLEALLAVVEAAQEALKLYDAKDPMWREGLFVALARLQPEPSEEP